MRCEDVLQQLPDQALGTLPDADDSDIRGHLRGCAACRGEAADLDRGLAWFASAHVAEPPPHLRDRVLSVLADEWGENTAAARARGRRSRARWLAVAAAVVLIGTAAWGSVAQLNANRAADDAMAYRTILATLGGRDVRVARLTSVGDSGVEGSAVLYDGESERSWVLVLVRAPGFVGDELTASIATPSGRAIDLFPVEIDAEGEGSTWLVTAGDISRYDGIRLTDRSGTLIGQGMTTHFEGEE